MKHAAFEIASVAAGVVPEGGEVTFKSQTIYGEGRYPVKIVIGHNQKSWFSAFEIDKSDARSTKQKPDIEVVRTGMTYGQVLSHYHYLFKRELAWGKTTLFDPDTDPQTIREKRKANGWNLP